MQASDEVNQSRKSGDSCMLWGYSPNFIKQVPLLNGTRGAKTCQTREFDIGVDKHSKLDPKEQ